MQSNTHIYILKLQNDKFYVGKSTNIESRLKSHFNKQGTKWTIQNQPTKIFALFESKDPFDEDLYTKKMMYKYGIDNVRGGSYTSLTLAPTQIELLQKEFATVDDRCFKCFNKHLSTECSEMLTFGKYKNVPVDDVYKFDKSYLQWLLQQKFITDVLKTLLQSKLKPDYRLCPHCKIVFPKFRKDVKDLCSKCSTPIVYYHLPFVRCDYCVKNNLQRGNVKYGDNRCCSCGTLVQQS